MNWEEINYWNNKAYGKAIKIKRSWIVGVIVFLCIITPATNWMIPFVKSRVKRGIIIRYDGGK